MLMIFTGITAFFHLWDNMPGEAAVFVLLGLLVDRIRFAAEDWVQADEEESREPKGEK